MHVEMWRVCIIYIVECIWVYRNNWMRINFEKKKHKKYLPATHCLSLFLYKLSWAWDHIHPLTRIHSCMTYTQGMHIIFNAILSSLISFYCLIFFDFYIVRWFFSSFDFFFIIVFFYHFRDYGDNNSVTITDGICWSDLFFNSLLYSQYASTVCVTKGIIRR